jgi:RHS repeat-associated protein
LKQQVNGNLQIIYTYDNNGNTLTKTEQGKTTESLWNDQNQLVGVSFKDASANVIHNLQYEYDTSGIRVSQNFDGEITKYLIDANLPYAQVLLEYRPSGLVVVSYTHGNDLISQTRDGESSFYHVDGLGSTRGLSDGNGNLIDTYNYQAFGNLLNFTGISKNNYLFAGEQLDPVLGDYYNRARYYAPETGRFTRRDIWEGSLKEPISLHKYLYANGNPILLIDPSGMTTLGDISASNAIWNQLIALSNMTSRVINVLDKVNGVVDAINFLGGIVEVVTSGQLQPYLEGAALSIATKPTYTIREVVDSLEVNVPKVLGYAFVPWSIWLGKYSQKVNSVILYLPNPGWLPPLDPVKTGIKIGNLPVELVVLSKKKPGSIIGTGFLAKGVPGADKLQQVWRMDYHGYDGTGKKDIITWEDPPFHYHVVKPVG